MTATTLMATGDLVLERDDATSLFSAAAPVLAEADLVIGHLEVPHTTSTATASSDVPALPAPPSALDAVAAAGFGVLTLAGNHVYDFGAEGIEDTRRHCRERGISTTGAGGNLAEAWEPAVVEHGGRQVIVLSVNCVGPKESWAGSSKAGCAWVEVVTHYEPRGANPGGPPRIYTFAEPRSLAAFTEQVAGHARQGAAVVVALHQGLVHQPVEIAQYQYEIAHAAIDAGAVAVLAHHAHILKGVEAYRGRPIFHGLGNFATVTRALGGAPDDSPERRTWARARTRLFGFQPDPAMPEYPFHPESRNTLIAVLTLGADGSVGAEVLPCWIDDDARPVPLTRANGGDQVGNYLQRITREAGLDTVLDWAGDRLTVHLKETPHEH
ncbi:CapA family protein [Arthrobacter koreensis]|uniref:CapA family protein n=1 Tax=Arthrobacter koreensis TaxID=199136 RepID=UPI0036D903EE